MGDSVLCYSIRWLGFIYDNCYLHIYKATSDILLGGMWLLQKWIALARCNIILELFTIIFYE